VGANLNAFVLVQRRAAGTGKKKLVANAIHNQAKGNRSKHPIIAAFPVGGGVTGREAHRGRTVLAQRKKGVLHFTGYDRVARAVVFTEEARRVKGHYFSDEILRNCSVLSIPRVNF